MVFDKLNIFFPDLFQQRSVLFIPRLIKKSQMPFRISQKLMLALAVKIHQKTSQVPEPGNGKHHSADPADILSCG